MRKPEVGTIVTSQSQRIEFTGLYPEGTAPRLSMQVDQHGQKAAVELSREEVGVLIAALKSWLGDPRP